MEPLNKKDRTRAFLKFSIFFVIGIVIILVPFYFIFRLPAAVSNVKLGEIAVLQEQLKYQHDYFNPRVQSLKLLFEKYDRPNEDLDKLNADIGLMLSEMENSIASDTSWRADMYHGILDTYLGLKKARNEWISCAGELKVCNEKLKEAKEELKPKDSLGD